MQRTVDFRYMILRNGADFGHLNALEGREPSLRMQDADAIKTSLAGAFLQPEEIDWQTDEIRPELVIDGTAYPLGVYAAATVTDEETAAVKSVQIEAYDRCWRVRDSYTETLLFYEAGTPYLTPIRQLLSACGIALVHETPTTAVLAEAREDWNIGTSYLTVINDLLAEINYNPLWFDQEGAAVLEPASVPTAENIEHVLDNSNVKSLLLPGITRETDIYKAPNAWTVICSNASKGAPLVAHAENNNPQSPLSVARRGRRIVSVVRVNNIADQEELQAYADRLRDESLISGESIKVETALLPGFGVADVTALHYNDLDAVCIERAWEMQLKPGGAMRHELERVVVNLD